MKKHITSMAEKIWALRGLLTVFCVAAVLFGVSFISHAEEKGSITGSNVNVRESASTSATAVATVNMNDLVDVLAETTGDDGQKWYKITTESGVTGYVRSDFIKKATVTVDVTQTDSKTAYIAGSNANIRQDASTSSGRVANALGGSKVTIIGEATGADGYKWYQIEFEGNGATMTGFIRSDLVTFEAPVQQPEVTEIEGEMGEGSEEESESEEPIEEPSEEPTEEPVEAPSEAGKVSIPLSGNEGTFIIMEPVSAVEILPQGFEQTELQLGEEIFTVWGKGQFYIMYASVNGGESQYYLYDAINKSFIAYTGLLTADDVAAVDGEKGLNFKLISIICVVIIVILAVVSGILIYKLSNAGYRDDDDDDDDDEYYEGEDEIYVDDDDEDEYVDLSRDDVEADATAPDMGDSVEALSQQIYETYDNPAAYASQMEAEQPAYEDASAYTAPVIETADLYEVPAEGVVSYEAPAAEAVYMTDDAQMYAAEESVENLYGAYGETQESVYTEEQVPLFVESEQNDDVAEELYDDGFDEEEEEELPKKSRKDKKAKKEKKKFSKRFLDYFTVEVDDDDEDYDDDYDDDDYEEDNKKKSSSKKFEDDDDDLNFIDL